MWTDFIQKGCQGRFTDGDETSYLPASWEFTTSRAASLIQSIVYLRHVFRLRMTVSLLWSLPLSQNQINHHFLIVTNKKYLSWLPQPMGGLRFCLLPSRPNRSRQLINAPITCHFLEQNMNENQTLNCNDKTVKCYIVNDEPRFKAATVATILE